MARLCNETDTSEQPTTRTLATMINTGFVMKLNYLASARKQEESLDPRKSQTNPQSILPYHQKPIAQMYASPPPLPPLKAHMQNPDHDPRKRYTQSPFTSSESMQGQGRVAGLLLSLNPPKFQYTTKTPSLSTALDSVALRTYVALTSNSARTPYQLRPARWKREETAKFVSSI
jgi:hypothetical protein